MNQSSKALRALSALRRNSSVLYEIHSRIINKPILATQEAIEQFVSSALHSPVQPEANLEAGQYQRVRLASGRQGGVIDISGPLAARSEFCGPMSYDLIRADISEAINDPNVDEIILRIDSPGGEASGCLELGEFISRNTVREGGEKPIYAFVDNYATSAAYWIAASADKVIIPRTAHAGSIGVYTAHVDQSEYNKNIGIKVTFFSLGEGKVDGNPHEALSDGAVARFETSIKEVYENFTQHVSNVRGIPVADVIEMGAAVVSGPKAVELGLADEIGTIADYLEGVFTMKDQKTAAAISTLALAAKEDDAPQALKSLATALAQIESGEDLVTGIESNVVDQNKPEAMPAEEIIQACSDAKLPALAATLVGSTREQVEAQIASVKGVVAACETLDLDAAAVVAHIGDPAAMISAAVSQYAESVDADIDGKQNQRSNAEQVSASWDLAADVARGKKRLNRTS